MLRGGDPPVGFAFIDVGCGANSGWFPTIPCDSGCVYALSTGRVGLSGLVKIYGVRNTAGACGIPMFEACFFDFALAIAFGPPANIVKGGPAS